MTLFIFLYILLYGTIYYMLYNVIDKVRMPNSKKYFCVLGTFIICLFPIWSGDYHHYSEEFYDLQTGYYTHMEEIYTYIAQNLVSNYFLFRLLLWGAGNILILLTFKRLSIRFHVALLYYMAISILWFSYARVSCGMALMFYGLSLLACPFSKAKLLSFLLGICLVLSSFFFHKSSLFGIAMIIAALFFYNMSKNKLFMFGVVYIVFVAFAGFYLNSFLSLDVDETIIDVKSAQKYLDLTSKHNGIGAFIQDALIIGNYYLILFIIFKTITSGSFHGFPRNIKIFTIATFFIISGASLFAFDLGYNTYIIYYRFLNFSIIPLCVFLAYCYDNGIAKKGVRLSLYIGFVSSIYTLLYSLYLSNR